MNSIDTCATGKPVALDSADAEIQAGLESDPIALAALLQLTAKVNPEELDTDPLTLAALVQATTTPEEGPVPAGAIAQVASQNTAPASAETAAATASGQGAKVEVEVPHTQAKEAPPVQAQASNASSKDTSDSSQSQEGMGDNILQSLNAQSSQTPTIVPTGPAAEVAATPRVDQAARIETFVSQIADRILVTDPLAGQNAQVHIKIADAVLPGTEIQLWRGDGGQLNVNFATTSAQSAQILTDASQMLAQRLNEKLSLSMPVVVSVQSGDGGMPQDGRSRQYQSVYDMLAAQQQSA